MAQVIIVAGKMSYDSPWPLVILQHVRRDTIISPARRLSRLAGGRKVEDLKFIS